MLKMLKADFYRLFRSFMFWVFLGIRLLSFIITAAGSIYTRIKGAGFDGEALTFENANIFEIETTVFSGIGILFAGLCIVYFYGKELKNGYIKNIAGSVERKEYCVFSKIILGIFTTLFYIAVDIIVTVIEWIVQGNRIVSVTDLYLDGGYTLCRSDVIKGWLSAYGTAIMISMAFIMLVVLLMEVFRTTAPVYVFDLMLVAGIIDEVIIGVFSLLQSWFGWFKGFEISDYLMTCNMQNFNCLSDNLARFAVMSVIYIAIFGMLAVWVNKKRDVV